MKLLLLKQFDNYFFANIAYAKLVDAGVECYLRDENTILMDPLLSNAIGGIKLEVVQNQYKFALDILKSAEQIYLNELVCGKCNSVGFTLIEKINKPTTIWGVIKNKILYGQSIVISKQYCCKTCNQNIDSSN